MSKGRLANVGKDRVRGLGFRKQIVLILEEGPAVWKNLHGYI